VTRTLAASDPRAEIFERHRGLLTGLAYRMLGSMADAEDVVQDAWLRWQGAPAGIDHPKAWLIRTATRLALDHLRAAKIRRRGYVGPWLPEPVADGADGLIDQSPGPELALELSYALLTLLETLSPAERAAFLLSEAFGYEAPEIASILGKQPAAIRQLIVRARKRIHDGRPRVELPAADRKDKLIRLLQAVGTRDTDQVMALLAPDVVFRSDGGGKVLAAINPVETPGKVARLLIGLAGKSPVTQTVLAEIQGQPAVIGYAGPHIEYVSFFTFDDGLITRIDTMRNPEKLRHLPAPVRQ